MTMVRNSEYSRVDSGSLSMRTDATTTTGFRERVPIKFGVPWVKLCSSWSLVVFMFHYSSDHGCRVTQACARFSIAGR